MISNLKEIVWSESDLTVVNSYLKGDYRRRGLSDFNPHIKIFRIFESRDCHWPRMIQPHCKAFIGGETIVQVERWIAHYVDREAICRAGGRIASLKDSQSNSKGASLSC